MHFTTTRTTDETVTMENWHVMKFKSDLLNVLKENGCLPVNTPEKALKLHNENKHLKE